MDEIPFIESLGDRLEAAAALSRTPRRRRFPLRRGSRRRLALWSAGVLALAGGGTGLAASSSPHPHAVDGAVSCRLSPADDRTTGPRQADRRAVVHAGC